VAWGVDQVYEEVVPLDFLGDVLEIILIGHVRVEGDGSGLDGDTSILFILARVRKTLFSRLGCGDDTSALDKGVGKGGLSVVDYKSTLSAVAMIGWCRIDG